MRLAIIGMASLILTGCQTTTTTITTPAVSPATVAPNGPGNEPLDGAMAASVFKQVCVEPYPQMAKTHTALTNLGYRQLPSTGTYYNGQTDVSFKLSGSSGDLYCSMVFASKQDPQMLSIMFASASQSEKSNAGVMTFTPRARVGKTTYFNAVLRPAK